MRINSSGNVGIGTNSPNTKLDVAGTINLNMNGSTGPPTANTYGGSGDRIVLYAVGGGQYPYSIGVDGYTQWYSCPGDASHKFFCGGSNHVTIKSTSIGIQNTAPYAPLNIGNPTVPTSDGYIVFSKYNSITLGYRNARIGLTYDFYFAFGDYGNLNNNSNYWSTQMAIHYAAPANSLIMNIDGSILMTHGYSSSDERIKTNIKTIENALDKTILLRGVNYNDFRNEPDQLRMGLIAQEVELIIPEVVGTDEKTTMKSIAYSNMIGLLVEAIKELNNKVTNLENILKNNNLI